MGLNLCFTKNTAILFLFWAFLAHSLFLSGCAEKTTIVLLPDPDGKVGHVMVATDAGSTDITDARAATEVKGRASLPTAPKILSEREIDAKFFRVLAILPRQPVHFILYFKSGSTELQPQSIKILPEILQSIGRKRSQNISFIGHSDTAGDPQYNLHLSRKRAETISSTLVKNGVDLDYIKTTSHGEKNPLVKTPDNAHEPKNRRVAVVVR